MLYVLTQQYSLNVVNQCLEALSINHFLRTELILLDTRPCSLIQFIFTVNYHFSIGSWILNLLSVSD